MARSSAAAKEPEPKLPPLAVHRDHPGGERGDHVSFDEVTMNEIRLYGYELDSMPEYSSTLPTGTTLWKQWRCWNSGAWWVGQYVPHPDPALVGIRWSRVVLRQGPPPRGWRAPDWSRFERRAA